MPESQGAVVGRAEDRHEGAGPKRALRSSLAGATAVALGFSGAMLGVTPAMADPGYSKASALYLSGSLLTVPLEQIAELEGERAVAPYGSQEEVISSGNLRLDVLDGVLTVEVADGVQIPIDLADAGVVGQYAEASPEGNSRAVAGLVTSEGVINVAPDTANPPGPLTFDLTDLLGDEFTDQVTGLTLTTGVNTVSAEQNGTDAPVGTYNIADLELNLTSPAVAGLSGEITDAVAPLEGSVNALVGPEGSVISELSTLIASLGGDVTSDVSLDLDLDPIVADVLSSNEILGVDGPVTVNLTDGTITVDVAALLAANGMDLNDLEPGTELMSTELVGLITAEVDSLVNGLLAEVDEAVTTALGAAVLNANLTLGDAVDPALVVAINGTLEEIASGAVVADVTVADGLVFDADVAISALQGAAQAALDLELNTAALDTALADLYPFLDDVLTEVVSLTANVQEENAGTFTQTGLRLELLNFVGDDGEVLALNLAQASVGPNAAVVAPDVTAVTGFTPTSGPEAGGTDVVITGDGFTGADDVLFGDTPAANVVIVSDEEIIATSPAGTGSVPLTVTGTDSGNDVTTDGLFTYIPEAAGNEVVLTSITPGAGPEAGGTNVTIIGDNFTGVDEVLFGTVPATNVVVVSDEEITATSPAGTGTVNVTVGGDGVEAGDASLPFTYVPEAAGDEVVLASITPGEGPEAGGTNVTIVGDNFTGVEEVLFGDVPATNVVVVSDEQITATSPAGTGTVNVTVAGDGVEAGDASLSFTYVPAVAGEPVIEAITPNEGPITGGTVVTIIGDGLGATEGVSFGSTPATSFEVISDEEVRAIAPEGAAGSVPVSLVIDGERIVAEEEFVYVAATTPVVPVVPVDPNNPGGGVIVPVIPVDPNNPSGFASCDAAEAAGVVTPISVSADPRMDGLDRDNDGIACEDGNGERNMVVTSSDSNSAIVLAAGLAVMILGGGILLFRRFGFMS